MRKLSNSLLSDVQDSLSVLPGAAPTQRLLAQNALAYLDRLAEESRDDPALLSELASGYIKVGNLRYAHLNDFDGALPIYEKAVDLYRKRVALAPNDQAAKRDLIGGLFALAELLSLRCHNDELLQVQEEGIALDHVRLASEPASAETMFELGTHLFARGETLESIGRQGDAKADFQAALDMAE